MSLRSFVTYCLACCTFTILGGRNATAAPPKLPLPAAEASTEVGMKPYTELIEHTDEQFEMLPIRGGKYLMGSPEKEPHRKADEGPQHEVEISPFWMAKCEITWDVYDVWMSDLDIVRRNAFDI